MSAREKVMNVADKIASVREYPSKASEEFRRQLERAREASKRLDGEVPPVKGMDRSGELTPLTRPTIIRTLVEPE
jgi:hypothetical protein